MINNKTLANSDFFTGAFPAEFGNSISGTFDLKLRNGNSDKHEVSAQFGFLGTEIFAEGRTGLDLGLFMPFQESLKTFVGIPWVGVTVPLHKKKL